MPHKPHLRLVTILLCLGITTSVPSIWLANAAWAQDGDDDDDGGEDDDDDDDDDAGGDTSGGSGGGASGGTGAVGSSDDGGSRTSQGDDDSRTSGATNQQPRRAPVVAPPPRELPIFAEGEIVTLGLTDADLATLLALGFRVLEERPVPEIGIIARRLSIPEGTTLEAARDQVRALPSGGDADFNHYYRTEKGLAPLTDPAVCKGQNCASQEQIGWKMSAQSATCTSDTVIGVIDTGINPDHAAFAAARLDVHRLAPDSLDPSRAIHGTAALLERGVIIVAAVGNGGLKADPSYPAAYPGVIAVTAVDASDKVYRRAGQGLHVDLAAPGVEVWTAASVSGAKPKTGTSFAAPFVTAAAAAALDVRPELDAETLIAELATSARDLGDPGRDDVYGFGLVQARQACGP